MRIAPVVSAAFSALIAVIVTGASVLIVFYARYQSLLIYQMNIEGDLSKEHVFRVLVPATAIALVVCLAVSLGIGALAASLSSGAVGTAPTPGPAGTIPTTNTTRRSAMKVTLKHSQSGMVKEAPVGFSWTTFFFGFFPALFRGDIKWAAIMFVVAFVTFGISWLVFPFIYNKLYIKGLLESGYVPADDESKSTLTAKGILIQG